MADYEIYGYLDDEPVRPRRMPEDRSEMEAARLAGLQRRHETREARAVRKAVAEEIAQALEAERIVRHCTPEGMACFGIAASLAREIGSRDPA